MTTNKYIYVGVTLYDEYIAVDNISDTYNRNDFRFYRVDRREFTSLVNRVKGTCIKNPIKFAFNRLHQERKTQVIL